jgi:hypothetical protein
VELIGSEQNLHTNEDEVVYNRPCTICRLCNETDVDQLTALKSRSRTRPPGALTGAREVVAEVSTPANRTAHASHKENCTTDTAAELFAVIHDPRVLRAAPYREKSGVEGTIGPTSHTLSRRRPQHFTILNDLRVCDGTKADSAAGEQHCYKLQN